MIARSAAPGNPGRPSRPGNPVSKVGTPILATAASRAAMTSRRPPPMGMIIYLVIRFTAS